MSSLALDESHEAEWSERSAASSERKPKEFVCAFAR